MIKYIGLLIFIFSLHSLYASRCVDLGPFTQKEFNETRLIINAEIIDIQFDSLTYERSFYLTIHTVFKGDVALGNFTIYTSGQLQVHHFSVGDSMLLFLNYFNNKPFISRCSRQYYIDEFSSEPALLELKKYLIKKDTLAKEYYSNGKLQSQGELINGLPHGEWQYFKEDGTLEMVGVYDKGSKQGVWKEYYNNEWHHQNYEKGIKNGIHLDYYENGNTKESGIYVNDVKTGIWTSFYKNSIPKEQIDWTTGKIYFWNTWNPNGEIMVRMGNGIHKHFDDDGIPERYSDSKIENGKFK